MQGAQAGPLPATNTPKPERIGISSISQGLEFSTGDMNIPSRGIGYVHCQLSHVLAFVLQNSKGMPWKENYDQPR